MKLNNIQKQYIEKKLNNLKKSKFRNSFHIRNYMIDYIEKKGWNKIESHCKDFIDKKIAPKNIPNDGKQTPMKNHPIFIAQHATATCCRGCINKWYKIPKDRELKDEEKKFIIALIMEWLKADYILTKEKRENNDNNRNNFRNGRGIKRIKKHN